MQIAKIAFSPPPNTHFNDFTVLVLQKNESSLQMMGKKWHKVYFLKYSLIDPTVLYKPMEGLRTLIVFDLLIFFSRWEGWSFSRCWWPSHTVILCISDHRKVRFPECPVRITKPSVQMAAPVVREKLKNIFAVLSAA